MQKRPLLHVALLCAWAVPGGGLAQSAASIPPSEQQALTWNGVITTRAVNRRTGTVCQFISGPKAHGWHDYAPFPPVPLDSTCDDGEGSVGFVQSAGHGDRY